MDERIFIGLQILQRNDGYLLEKNTSERSITHKLGDYYQRLYPNWDVDCEFNKNLGGPKEINIDPKKFLKQMADFLETNNVEAVDKVNKFFRKEKINKRDIKNLVEQLKNPELIYDEELDVVDFVLKLNNGKKMKKTIFPDIIIHHRGTTDNYIVVEAKKSTNRNKRSRAYDLIKLVHLVESSKYNYQLGIFIDIPTAKDSINHKRFVFEPIWYNGRIVKVFSSR